MIFSSTVISPNEQAFNALKSVGLFDIAASKKDCANAIKLSFFATKSVSQLSDIRAPN